MKPFAYRENGSDSESAFQTLPTLPTPEMDRWKFTSYDDATTDDHDFAVKKTTENETKNDHEND